MLLQFACGSDHNLKDTVRLMMVTIYGTMQIPTSQYLSSIDNNEYLSITGEVAESWGVLPKIGQANLGYYSLRSFPHIYCLIYLSQNGFVLIATTLWNGLAGESYMDHE